MANWGNCDFDQLLKLQDNFAKLTEEDWERFCESCLKEMAKRLLSLVIPRTPVGVYSKKSGKKGGTLRRGWTGGKSGGKGQAYSQGLRVKKKGSIYEIEIINPVKYASYVEYGHRLPGGTGWVKGQFFLTVSERDLQLATPAIIEKKLQTLFKGVFNV